jgi:hypothetical protein
MIENIQNNHVAHRMGISAAPHADPSGRPTADNSDATVQVHFADMVNQALQTTETDTDAVERARQLLQSNQLTSPENIRAVAENLLTFGI